MANIYVVDKGVRTMGDASDASNINLTIEIEYASDDGSLFGEKAFLSIQISRLLSSWKLAFEAAANAWAAARGHVIVKFIESAYGVAGI